METSSFIILFFKLVHNKPEKQVTHNWTVTVLSHGVNKLHQISLHYSLRLSPAASSLEKISLGETQHQLADQELQH